MVGYDMKYNSLKPTLRDVVVMMMTTLITAASFLLDDHLKAPVEECQSCPECYQPTMHDTMYNITKYAIYVDSLTYGKKKDQKRFKDSVDKYGRIINAK